MGKSFKAYIAAFGKWGFIVAAIIIGDVIGIIQSNSASFIMPTWAWWSILVVILAITPFIAFHKLRLEQEKLQNKLDAIENAQPIITVEPAIEGHRAVLIVKNIGNSKANFSAKARLMSFTSTPRLQDPKMFLQLPWESYNEVDCPLKGGGDEAKLLVAGKEAVSKFNSGDLSGLPDILKKKGVKIVKTYSYDGELLLFAFINKVLRKTPLYQWHDDNTADTKPPSYTCEIEIKIFADPALRKSFKRIYQLQLKGHGLSFIEKSNFDKEDSQTE